MEKKYKALIITVVILSICVFILSGYIIYDKIINNNNEENNLTSKSELNNNNDDKEENNNNDENVASEINKLISYLNGNEINYFEDEDDGFLSSCTILGSDRNRNKLLSNKDFFEDLQVIMYNCLHDVTLTYVNDNMYNGSRILSNEQYIDYKKYFYEDLEPYDNTLNNLSKDSSNPQSPFYELYQNAKQYSGKKYYKGYEIGDGFSANEVTYEVISINKISTKTYNVVINAIANYYIDENNIIKYSDEKNTYQGTLKVEVVGNYLKYNPLTFKKIN